MADTAHRLTDEKLEEMEKRLSAIYSRAEKEIGKRWKEYLAESQEEIDELQKAYDLAKKGGDEKEIRKAGKKLANAKRERTLMDKRFKALTETTAVQLANVNKTALAYVNGQLPEVYSINYNALEQSVDGVGGYSFALIDADTVKNLATTDKSLLPYKQLDEKADIRWNMKKMNAEVLQGILQGEPMDRIVVRLAKVVDMNETAAIRNARTMVTGAENKGRQDSYARAEADGIILERTWLATNDSRTRHSHAVLDGETKPIDTPFSNGLMYPGDPNGRPEEVWNCRCTVAAKVNGFNKVQYNKSHGLAPTNRDGKEIIFSDKMQNGKWNESVDIITELSGQYKTKLLDVGIGSEKSAGSVQISGSIMRLSSTSTATAVHEFAHTISMENQTKFGLYDEKDFWKEIRGVQRKYKKAVADDPTKWISSYEHSSKGADEFMAEAFTHAQMKEMGLELPSRYGKDFTYSEMVLKIIKKYFGR